ATSIRLDGIGQERAIVEAIELEIHSPEYFERDVQVLEQLSDVRGKTHLRQLGSAHFVKAADRPPSSFRVAVTAPSGPEVTIQIADGDNAPLVVAQVHAEKSRRRVNFVFAAGDDLRLLSGNDAAT